MPQPHATSPQPPLVLSNHGLRHSGGIERYLLTLIDSLHRMGVRPTIVAHKFDTGVAEYQWVNPVHLGTWGLGGALRDRLFDWKLRRRKAQAGWYPVVALSQTAAADIAISGGTHPGYLQASGKTARWKDRLTIDLEKMHLSNASVVIAHSELMAKQVHSFYGVPNQKIDVLYPPVDTKRFSPVSSEQRQSLRAKLGLPDDRCVFLLASTGHARKGLDLLIDALGQSQLPVLLVVAGRPVTSQAPNLRYLGYRSDIEDVYRAVDCTVMASNYEPFGLVGVESVMCGTPLIGANGMGCMEVLQGDGVMPFTIGTPAAQTGSLAQAIDEALSRWRRGTLRVSTPMAALRYDPSADAHVKALLAHVEALRSRRQEARA